MVVEIVVIPLADIGPARLGHGDVAERAEAEVIPRRPESTDHRILGSAKLLQEAGVSTVLNDDELALGVALTTESRDGETGEVMAVAGHHEAGDQARANHALPCGSIADDGDLELLGRHRQGAAGLAKPGAIPIVDRVSVARRALEKLDIEGVAGRALCLGERTNGIGREHIDGRPRAIFVMGAREQKCTRAIERARKPACRFDQPEHVGEEIMGRGARNERRTDEPVEPACPHCGAVQVSGGLSCQRHRLILDQRLDRFQAADIEIDVQPAEGIEDQIACGVGPADGVVKTIVCREKIRITLGDQGARRRAGP